MAFIDFSHLSFEELQKEIDREEEELVTLRSELTSLHARQAEIERMIEDEQLLRYPDRVKARLERIRKLEEEIAEREAPITHLKEIIDSLTESILSQEARSRRVDISPAERLIARRVAGSLRRSRGAYRGWIKRIDRVAYWTDIIDSLTESILSQEARSRRVDISPAERLIARNVASSLRRKRGAYRGWIKRYTGYLETRRRSLGQLRRWQITEEALVERLRLLRDESRTILERISVVEGEITSEEERLVKKKEELEKRYRHVTLTANVDTESEGVVIIISISLDYDVTESKIQYYLTYATTKIRLWFKDMFYGSITAEPSVVYSDTPPEIIRELISRKEEVTDIFYDWYWFRRGKFASRGQEIYKDNKLIGLGEKDKGNMTWDEDIPLGERAGAKRGRKKRK